MNFLPIVTRELRVASRRKGTYWVRWVAAGIAILVAAIFLAFVQLANPTGGGSHAFTALAFYTFGLCLLAGVFLTADCLSEEKREGTIGLFFLTDLKGYDVVLGKLAATSLNGAYGLMALLPVLSLPLLVGGVTGPEFWRTALALLNALFFSLAAGIWISACSRHAQIAMVVTLVCIGAVITGGFLANEALRAAGAGLWADAITANPLSTMLLAADSRYSGNPMRYLVSLGCSHLYAWLFVVLASISLPRSWQEKPALHEAIAQRTGKLVGGRNAAVGQRQVLDQNPIVWLMSGSVALTRLIWALAIVVAVILFLSSVFPHSMVMQAISWVTSPVLFVLKLILAMRATMFFAEARRNGAMELLLSTPLTNAEIIHGQVLALKRMFFKPVLVVCLAMLFRIVAHVAIEGVEVEAVGVGAWIAYGALKFVVNVYAIAWFGMWMALTCRKPALASAWTILFAVVLPTAAFCIPNIAIDLALIVWSKHRLQTNFRNLARIA